MAKYICSVLIRPHLNKFYADVVEVFCQVFSVLGNVILLSIIYYARLGVDQAKIDNDIHFGDSYYLDLRYGGHFDNSYEFSKEYLTTSKIW